MATPTDIGKVPALFHRSNYHNMTGTDATMSSLDNVQSTTGVIIGIINCRIIQMWWMKMLGPMKYNRLI